VWSTGENFVVLNGVASDYRRILGATIREYRKRAKLTQERLAEKADLHPNYFGRLERGEEHVSLIALRRIAHALKVRVRDLVADL
jgi:transcriptional regulator with XRE-family HTH domain